MKCDHIDYCHSCSEWKIALGKEQQRSDDYLEEIDIIRAQIKPLYARSEKYKAALLAVSKLHDKYDGPHTYCRDCGGLTPCETRRIVDSVITADESDGE